MASKRKKRRERDVFPRGERENEKKKERNKITTPEADGVGAGQKGKWEHWWWEMSQVKVIVH